MKVATFSLGARRRYLGKGPDSPEPIARAWRWAARSSFSFAASTFKGIVLASSRILEGGVDAYLVTQLEKLPGYDRFGHY